MLMFFRSFFKSKIGVVVTLAFLGLIALAFASSDVSNSGIFGGVAGGDRVAVVGDKRITAADLSNTITNEFERQRAENPTLSMENFVALGGVTNTLDGMLDRWAISDFTESFGLRAGKRLVDSEIASNPQLRGPDGNFSQEVFRQLLQQQGLSEAAVRESMAQSLLARQLVIAAGYGAQAPASITRRYAQLLAERRNGRVGAIPAGVYAPTGDPSQAVLQQFYTDNRAKYIRPERRVVRYASFGEDVLTDLAPPTDAQIAERYQRDIANYRAKETRGLTQLILPTQAAAQAVINEVNAGTALDASARAKGLATTNIAPVDQSALASQTSAAVAAAAFAAERGAIAAPAQGGLGWYVLRVDSIERDPGRTLAQVRSEIAAALTTEQRRTALNEATARIEDEMGDGRSLTEVAEELGLTLQTTRPITAVGQVYGTSDTAPAALAPVISLAFELDEGEPQLAETVPGTSFLIFDVSDITASATAPLADIRDDVILGWRRAEGMKGAAAAAERIVGRMRDGQTLAAAMTAEGKTLPASQPINMARSDLESLGQQVPAPIMLFFSMAEGTVKALAQEANLSWFVVQLDDITTPDLPANDERIAATGRDIGNAAQGEYIAQLVTAVRNGLDIETNQSAVDAVIAQLTGRNN